VSDQERDRLKPRVQKFVQQQKGMYIMSFNLRNRSFVKELDFTPEELSSSSSSCPPT
jgi:hypothetical protein